MAWSEPQPVLGTAGLSVFDANPRGESSSFLGQSTDISRPFYPCQALCWILGMEQERSLRPWLPSSEGGTLSKQ